MKNMTKIQSHPNCPTQLSEEQIRLYHQQGFLAFENVLSPEEVEQAKTSISALIQKAHQHYPSTLQAYPSESLIFKKPNGDFFVQMEPDSPAEFKSSEELEHHVRKIANYLSEDAFLQFTCIEHPKLRGVLESLVGKAPIHFQNMGLLKPPFGGIEKPWHQDNAYFSVTPLESVIGIWIALDEAKADNGCMHVIPGGHLEGARVHIHAADCEIESQDLPTERSVAVELKPGGALFFYGMLPHMTPTNHSPERRRALQYHYRAATSQIVDKGTYNQVFATADGTPASCAMQRKPREKI